MTSDVGGALNSGRTDHMGDNVENEKNSIYSMKNAKVMALMLSVCFLCIHIFMLFLFYKYKVYPMAYFNIFSIAFYAFSILIVLKGYLRYYHIFIYLEVVLHMSLAVYFTGWTSGFQVTIISMNILLFYSLYLVRRLKIQTPGALPFACIGMTAYLILCVVNYYHEAEYPLPPNVSFMFQIFWGFTVFVITITSLNVFVNMALKSEEFLEDVADHDQLTGLPNRYYMTDYINKLHDTAGLEGNWLAMVDIDDFKVINDTHGHNCGDVILQQLAQILRDQGDKMTVCRWGGEEFLIVGKESDLPDGKDKMDVMNHLCSSIRQQRFFYNNLSLHITVTIGVASYHTGMNMREWIEYADNHLFEGKRNGKDKVVA